MNFVRRAKVQQQLEKELRANGADQDQARTVGFFLLMASEDDADSGLERLLLGYPETLTGPHGRETLKETLRSMGLGSFTLKQWIARARSIAKGSRG
jgi:hypothetical protein